MSNGAYGTGSRDIRVVVIGAGMSGLCMASALRHRGISNFTVYEKADEVGGTWRDNTYPGLQCDVPSRYYSYSFAPNPGWSKGFSPGPEIHQYFVRFADDQDLRRNIRFGAAVTRAEWVDGHWELKLSDGSRDTADVVVGATGVLHLPRLPEIEGLQSFVGPCFHSARWDHSVSYAGKRVGLIGTGSSGVQIISALAEDVQSLSVFQRTAQWVAPVPNFTYSTMSKSLWSRAPILNRLSYRLWRFYFERGVGGSVVNPGVRRRVIQGFVRASHRLLIRDPRLREKLHPEYEPLCRRLVMSVPFFRAVQRPNVSVLTEGINRVIPQGVITTDGKLHELDILVCATGFDAHSYLRPMEVIGRDGIKLSDAWSDGPRAYRAVGLAGFPNFFLLIGPNSPIGNNSLISIAETQVKFAMHWIDEIRSGRVESVAPTPEAAEIFNSEVRRAMPNTVWSTGCDSWYLGADGVPELWPWPPVAYRRTLASPIREDFAIT
ncbi:MAG: flavin-containing monooxygenase [Mycobacterium sp.]